MLNVAWVLALSLGWAQGVEVGTGGEMTLNQGAALVTEEDLSVLGAVTLSAADADLRVKGLSVGAGAALSAAAGTIRLTGNWTNQGNWTPGLSTVILQGNGNQAIAGTALTFFNLTSSGTIVVLLTDVQVDKVLSLPSGRLRVPAGRKLTVSTETHAIAGTLDLDHSGAGVATLVVNGTLVVSGALEMKRESAAIGDTSMASISGPGTIQISGQLWAKYFQTIGGGSLVLLNGSRIVDFSEGASAWKLDLSSATAIPFSLSAMAFTGATSIQTGAATPKLAILGGSGATTASDPSGKISWVNGAIVRLSDGAAYDTLAQALLANGGASAMFRVADVRLNDSIDLNAFPIPTGGHVLENAVFAPMQPIGGNRLALADGAQRIRLRNAIVARGGLQNVIVENGTLFPMDDANLVLAGVAQKNVIRQGVATTIVDAGNKILELSPLAADLTYFMGRSQVNFHLRSTAQLAIDQGLPIAGWTSPQDWEGEDRPIGTAWDIGADERNPEPPVAPVVVVTPLDAAVQVEWTASPSSDVTHFRVRWRKTGGDWIGEVQVEGLDYTPAGLENGQSYDFGVSAMDEAGNYSAEVVKSATPMYPIAVNGFPYPTVQAAIAAAQPGQTVQLGVGTFYGDVVLKDGVSLRGYSAYHTKLIGSGTAAVVTLLGTSEVSHLSITNGTIGISAEMGEANLHHLVVHSINGPAITAGGKLQVVNTTIMNNAGRGIWATSDPIQTTIRNNVVGKNGGGIWVAAGSNVTYNSAWGSFLEADYAPGITGNAVEAALFVSEAAGDYREAAGSASIDGGDPQDPFANEPAPHGNLINLGAFGNTPWAAASGAVAGGGSTTVVVINNEASGGGGGCGCVGLEALLLLALFKGLRRVSRRGRVK